MALLLNANTAGGFQSGEASLVGVDSDGAVAPSTDGSFFWNGERVRVVVQAVDGNDATKSYTLLTNEADRFGYIAIDIADRGVFKTATHGDLNVALVWEEGGQWKYDQNEDGPQSIGHQIRTLSRSVGSKRVLPMSLQMGDFLSVRPCLRRLLMLMSHLTEWHYYLTLTLPVVFNLVKHRLLVWIQMVLLRHPRMAVFLEWRESRG